MMKPSHSEKMVIKKGTWSPEEDRKLVAYIKKYGIWNWSHIPKAAGLSRSGKSCRLRWMNYLRPDLKHGNFTEEEEETILTLYDMLGSRWSEIAKRLPGRTDNEVKNFFNTHLRKKCSLKNEAVKATDRELQGTQTPSVSTEFEEWNLSENNQLFPLLVSPTEASSSGESSYIRNFPIMSPHLYANNFSSLTSSLSDIVNGEVNNNQFLVEENNGLILQSSGELQSWWEELGQPFPTETLHHNDHQAGLYTNDGQSLIEEYSIFHPYDSHIEDSRPSENNLSSLLPPTTSNSTTEPYEEIPSQQSPGLLLADNMSSPTSFLEYNRNQTVQTIMENVGCSSLNSGTSKDQHMVENLGSFDSLGGGQPISFDDSYRPLTQTDHKSFEEVIFPDAN